MLALLDEQERDFQDAFIRGAPPLGPGAPPRERLIAFGCAVLATIERHGDLIRAAELNRPAARMSNHVYAAYRAHVVALIGEARPEADADYIGEVLLAALSADLVLYLRRVREMSPERVRDGWTALVERHV